jgi:hypothetical protein
MLLSIARTTFLVASVADLTPEKNLFNIKKMKPHIPFFHVYTLQLNMTHMLEQILCTENRKRFEWPTALSHQAKACIP